MSMNCTAPMLAVDRIRSRAGENEHIDNKSLLDLHSEVNELLSRKRRCAHPYRNAYLKQ